MTGKTAEGTNRREFGDYQTPSEFAQKVCRFLKEKRQILPSFILEPTCGKGNFLQAALLFDAKKYVGIEINPDYCRLCSEKLRDSRVKIHCANVFQYDFTSLRGQDNPLILGNPPWVNNSALSSSGNLPEKVNFKGWRGIEALTGASNFDICEAIILRLVHAFQNTNAVIAQLCKMSVARNVFQELKRESIPFLSCEMIAFDAFNVFGTSVGACLLLIRLSETGVSPDYCEIRSFDDPDHAASSLFSDSRCLCKKLPSEVETFDGKCCFLWRQGVKHDCASVMELSKDNGVFRNGRKEAVDVEYNLIFPLVKSSMFKRPILSEFTKFVIVTQKKIKEDTAHIEKDFPETWAYLMRNQEFFNQRKSAVYRNTPPFSMFGIGSYSYAAYKVAVSGFYKRPLFSLLFSPDGKPVMTDDTSYFICFDAYDAAYTAMLLFNSDLVQNLLSHIAFLDAKRPYTKKVLSRIDVEKIYAAISFPELKKTEQALQLDAYLTEEMFWDFASVLQTPQS